MAISSGIGLKEKYLQDDSLETRLDKFDAVIKSLVKTNTDLVKLEKDKEGNTKITVLGSSDQEKKKNLRKFLGKISVVTQEYQTILDKQFVFLNQKDIQFDEKIDEMISNLNKEELAKLTGELGNVFDLMNLEINTVMKQFKDEST
ncbi:MAG: hypothetical protein GXP45_03715 [bacterium]|nr:hypothetical protein [bacterium]